MRYTESPGVKPVPVTLTDSPLLSPVDGVTTRTRDAPVLALGCHLVRRARSCPRTVLVVGHDGETIRRPILQSRHPARQLGGRCTSCPTGADVTTYLVIGDPPVLDGLVHDTLALALAAAGVHREGAEGFVDEPYAGRCIIIPSVTTRAPTSEVRNESRMTISF